MSVSHVDGEEKEAEGLGEEEEKTGRESREGQYGGDLLSSEWSGRPLREHAIEIQT